MLTIAEFSPLYTVSPLKDEARRMDVVILSMPREDIRKQSLRTNVAYIPRQIQDSLVNTEGGPGKPYLTVAEQWALQRRAGVAIPLEENS